MYLAPSGHISVPGIRKPGSSALRSCRPQAHGTGGPAGLGHVACRPATGLRTWIRQRGSRCHGRVPKQWGASVHNIALLKATRSRCARHELLSLPSLISIISMRSMNCQPCHLSTDLRRRRHQRARIFRSRWPAEAAVQCSAAQFAEPQLSQRLPHSRQRLVINPIAFVAGAIGPNLRAFAVPPSPRTQHSARRQVQSWVCSEELQKKAG